MFLFDALGAATSRLVQTQCSCSSGFSSELRPWIGSSLTYDFSLVTRGSVRFHIQSFKKITTWTRSSALIGPEGKLLVFLMQAPFMKIEMHRFDIRPAPTGTDEMHTTQGQDIHNSNCSNALRALCGSFSCAVHPCARTVDSKARSLTSKQVAEGATSTYRWPVSLGKWFGKRKDCRFCFGFPACLEECRGTC